MIEKTYKSIGDRKLKIDIFEPRESHHTHTAVILLHGGGWRHGDKSMMNLFGPVLAGHGFVAFAPEYRLLGESPWPAQIEDVKSAIRWVRANAAVYKIDPTKIALEGFSAGGHLALLAGGTPDAPETKGKDNANVSDAVSAIVAFFPPVEFAVGNPSPETADARILLGEDTGKELARKISPIHHVSKDFPPTFFLHGTADKIVSCENSKRMFAELEKNGVHAEMHLYSKHTHEFVRLPSMVENTQMEIALFLKRLVVDPENFDQENLKLNFFARM